MPKFAHQDVFDNGLNAIKNGATRVLVLRAYAFGDSYATVVSNKVGEAVMSSADFTLGTSGNNRTLTTAAKSATASAAMTGTPNTHFAFTDNASKVLWVTDEANDATFANGSTLSIPSLVYTKQQPT
jgi:hypothetical protein